MRIVLQNLQMGMSNYIETSVSGSFKGRLLWVTDECSCLHHSLYTWCTEITMNVQCYHWKKYVPGVLHVHQIFIYEVNFHFYALKIKLYVYQLMFSFFLA